MTGSQFPVEVKVDVAPDFKNLAYARARLVDAVDSVSALSSNQVADLRLAASEATTNAIEAHRRAKSEAPVQMAITIDADTVEVVVVDHGGGFDPDKLVAHPPVTDPERLEYERGLGVPLMRRLTDSCDIDSGPNGTRVRLVMHRR